MPTINLLVHLESTGEEAPPFVWWAESDALPGFSAAADTLPELIAQSTAAVKELRGPESEVRFDLAGDDDRDDQDLEAPRLRSTHALAG